MRADGAVTLTQGVGALTVSNGLVSVTINQNGQLTQLSKGVTPLMGNSDAFYVSESGGATYYAMAASSFSIVRQTDDLVELSFVDTSGGVHDMDWDLHYVVRSGISGFYYFLVAQTGTATHPNAFTLSELRSVQRFDPAILSNGYNGERHGALPTAAQNATFMPTTQVQDTTWPLTIAPFSLAGFPTPPGFAGQGYDEGPVYSKYDWATYRVEDQVHGLYGNGYGAWLVSPSWEFYTGGPVKQELMVHQDNLILNMYHGGHFGSAIGATSSPTVWQKLYGPNLVYVNSGSDAEVIGDAVKQSMAERAEWPYSWMQNSLYPLEADRTTVTGQIKEAHGRSAAGVMVTLADPGALLPQGYNYMFWGTADLNGHFVIPGVRAGTYAVHVFATEGTIIDDPANGEIVGGVTISAGTGSLGTLLWSPPYHSNLLWSIGVSDQRSGEFRFSTTASPGGDNIGAHTARMYGPDAQHGVWTVPPANLTYTIGTSTPQTDWYFAQSVDGVWTVKFDLASVPPNGAYLTVAIAGQARSPQLTIGVNGHQVASVGFNNDQSLYRSAHQGGQFQMLTIAIPGADLQPGANTVTFAMNTKGAAGAGLFYDVVKMESD